MLTQNPLGQRGCHFLDGQVRKTEDQPVNPIPLQAGKHVGEGAIEAGHVGVRHRKVAGQDLRGVIGPGRADDILADFVTTTAHFNRDGIEAGHNAR